MTTMNTMMDYFMTLQMNLQVIPSFQYMFAQITFKYRLLLSFWMFTCNMRGQVLLIAGLVATLNTWMDHFMTLQVNLQVIFSLQYMFAQITFKCWLLLSLLFQSRFS